MGARALRAPSTCRASVVTRLRCPDNHTVCPEGYLAWYDWAERKSLTHEQERCPECGLWAIWKRKRRKAS